MKVTIPSVINHSSYQAYKNQQVKKWAVVIALFVLCMILCYSFIFEETLQNNRMQFNDLSLGTRIELLNQLFNPWGLLFSSGLLIWLFAATHNAVRKSIAFPQSRLEVIKVNDAGQFQAMFGPAFINIGLTNIIILKNYGGYIHVLLPLYPSENELYFINNTEKIDHTISLRTHTIQLDMVCRTKEGIPVAYRSVSVSYRFMANIPSRNQQSNSRSMKNDLEKVRWNLLRRGQLNSSQIAHICTELVIQQVTRKYLLDELDKKIQSRTIEIQPSAIDLYLQNYRAFKLKTIRKHWHILRFLRTADKITRQKMRHAVLKRPQRKQIHTVVKSDQLYSHMTLITHDKATISSTSINQKIEQSLRRELQKYNLELIKVVIPAALPSEKLVSQKIEQSLQKSNDLFQTKKGLQAYQQIQHSKMTFSNTIQASAGTTFTPSLQMRFQEELLIEKARKAGIPDIDSGNETRSTS